MTLREFWDSKEKLVINCKTRTQANIFCQESDKLGKTWSNKKSYLDQTDWEVHRADTCYTNEGTYCPKSWYQENGYKILNFEDIDWEEKMIKIDWTYSDAYSFRVMESRRSVSLYKNDTLLKRVYCHEDDEFDWKIGLGIALQRTVYKDDKDVLYLSKTIQEKVLNGEELNEEELRCLSSGVAGHLIEEIEGDDHRWQREMSVIFEIQGRYFRLDYMKGLTEHQEDDFYEQPYEVIKKEKTIVVNNWVKKEDEENGWLFNL